MLADEWSLGEHIKIHTGQNRYFCSICGTDYFTLNFLNKHLLEHTNKPPQVLDKKNGILCDVIIDKMT